MNYPVEYGGLGLDYKYQMAMCEAAGNIRAPGVGMGIGVHTDCATPALAKFGSDELKKEFLVPAIKGTKWQHSNSDWSIRARNNRLLSKCC